MLRTVILPALLVLVFSLSLSTSADARRWRHHNGYERTDQSMAIARDALALPSYRRCPFAALAL